MADIERVLQVCADIQYHPHELLADPILVKLSQDALLVRKAVVAQTVFFLRCHQEMFQQLSSRFRDEEAKITVIGAGLIGDDIVSSILSLNLISPNNLTISTRRPDKLTKYSEQGVKCLFDNKSAVSQADIVVLACLPAQLPGVIQDIKKSISKRCLVISTIAGHSYDKMTQLLNGHPHVLVVEGSPAVFADLSTEERVQAIEAVTDNGLHIDNPDIVLRLCPPLDHDAIDDILLVETRLFDAREDKGIERVCFEALLGCDEDVLRERALATTLSQLEDYQDLTSSQLDNQRVAIATVMSFRKHFVDTMTSATSQVSMEVTALDHSQGEGTEAHGASSTTVPGEGEGDTLDITELSIDDSNTDNNVIMSSTR